jgi:hypothetical protein
MLAAKDPVCKKLTTVWTEVIFSLDFIAASGTYQTIFTRIRRVIPLVEIVAIS